MAELDRACREAALAGAVEGGLGAPFCLFVNADASALEDDLPATPRADFTLVMEVTERALTERPEPLLRALTELRRMGWGVALDDVGADSRSLALMPVLYPDVIKLDLRLLRDREPEDVARIVTAVGAEAEKRLATVLAEGIDSDEQLATARAAGAALGQGYLLGEPAPLPDELPSPGRGLRLTSSGGVPENVVPFQRVTNWRRPATGSPELAERTAALLSAQAAQLGSTGLLLAATPDDDPIPAPQLERYERLAREIGFVGVLGGAAEPGRRPARRPAARGRPAARHLDRGRARPRLRRLLRRPPRRGRQLALRDLLRPRDGRGVRGRADGADAVAGRGRLAPDARAELRDHRGQLAALPRHRRGALVLRAQLGARDRLGVALADRVRVLRVGLVAARHDDRRERQLGELRPCLERARARHGAQRVGDRLRVLVGAEPLAQHLVDRLVPALGRLRGAVGLHEALHPAGAQPVRQRVPAAQPLPLVLRVVSGSKAGVITTRPATRSPWSSAKRTIVCAPIEAPASSARSIPRSSSTASRSAARSS